MAIVEVDEQKHEKLFNSFGVKVFASINELNLSEIKFDLASVCTPNGQHNEHADQMIDFGKHVLVEKPFSLYAPETEKLIQKAKDKNLQLFGVMQNRYSPPSRWLKSLIEENRLGNIYSVVINCIWNREAAYFTESSWKGNLHQDGGPLFTQFSHFVDTLYWLFGKVEITHAEFQTYKLGAYIEFEDSGLFSFRLKDGGHGTFNYSIAAYESNLESSITIIGANGSVKVGGQYMNEVQICNIAGYSMPELDASSPPNNYGPYKGSAANHHFVYENIASEFNGKTSMIATAKEGAAVVAIINDVYAFRAKASNDN